MGKRLCMGVGLSAGFSAIGEIFEMSKPKKAWGLAADHSGGLKAFAHHGGRRDRQRQGSGGCNTKPVHGLGAEKFAHGRAQNSTTVGMPCKRGWPGTLELKLPAVKRAQVKRAAIAQAWHKDAELMARIDGGVATRLLQGAASREPCRPGWAALNGLGRLAKACGCLVRDRNQDGLFERRRIAGVDQRLRGPRLLKRGKPFGHWQARANGLQRGKGRQTLTPCCPRWGMWGEWREVKTIHAMQCKTWYG